MSEDLVKRLQREINSQENLDALFVLRRKIERMSLRKPDRALLYEEIFVRKKYLLDRYPEDKEYFASKP